MACKGGVADGLLMAFFSNVVDEPCLRIACSGILDVDEVMLFMN